MAGRGEQALSPARQHRPWRIAGALTALVTLSYLTLGKVILRDDTLRYALTVEVETPAGLRRGSSIIEARIHRTTPFWGDNGIHYQLRGEAPAVELPDGRLLFALLHDSTNIWLPERAARDSNALPPISNEILRGSNRVGAFWPELKSARPDMPVRPWATKRGTAQSYPDLVVLRPADVQSIQAVDPEASGAVLGQGVRFIGLRIAIVDAEPEVTLDRRAPWVSEISQRLDRLAAASGPLHNSLNPSRFIARN